MHTCIYVQCILRINVCALCYYFYLHEEVHIRTVSIVCMPVAANIGGFNLAVVKVPSLVSH